MIQLVCLRSTSSGPHVFRRHELFMIVKQTHYVIKRFMYTVFRNCFGSVFRKRFFFQQKI